MTARSSRALLAFTMLTFMTAEASHGRPLRQEQQCAVLHAEPAGRAVEVEGHRAREQRGGRDAAVHLGGTDRGVRATGRPAHHGKPVDAQGVSELFDVGRPVDQATPRLVGREPHAGAVGGDEPDALGHGGFVGGGGVEAGAQPAVEAEHGEARRVAVLLVGQLPPVGQRHGIRHARSAPSPAVWPGDWSGPGCRILRE